MFKQLFIWKKSKLPTWWLYYLDRQKSSPSTGLSSEHHRFVIVDTETTGLNPDKAVLLSIAAFGLSRNSLTPGDHYSCIIRQQYKADPENVSIHGIMPDHSRAGIPESEAIQGFLKYCDNAIIVGHHIGFDLKYLNNSLQKLIPGARIKNKSIDIINLAQKLERHPNQVLTDEKAYSLDQLCNRYNIAPVERHTAEGDAWVTGILFLKLLKKIRKGGWTKTRHLIR